MVQRSFYASLTFMFRELAVAARFDAIRGAGFAGAEIQFLEEAPLGELVAAQEASGLPVNLINCGLGDFITGGPGLSGVPGRESDFRHAFDAALEAADRLGATYLHCGPSRLPEGVSRAVAMEVYHSNIHWAVDKVRNADTTLLIEPVNRADKPASLQTDWGEIAGLIASCATPKLRLLMDTYHCAADGLVLLETFTAHQDMIAHVQLADFPRRAAPGTGEIDFPGLLSALENAGYSGTYGIEYMPQGPTLESLGWMSSLSGGSHDG